VPGPKTPWAPKAGCLADVEVWLLEPLVEPALDDGELPVEAAGAGACVATGWVTGVPV
jgi:hypothetical protein